MKAIHNLDFSLAATTEGVCLPPLAIDGKQNTLKLKRTLRHFPLPRGVCGEAWTSTAQMFLLLHRSMRLTAYLTTT